MIAIRMMQAAVLAAVAERPDTPFRLATIAGRQFPTLAMVLEGDRVVEIPAAN
jgi:hypothetical protein